MNSQIIRSVSSNHEILIDTAELHGRDTANIRELFGNMSLEDQRQAGENAYESIQAILARLYPLGINEVIPHDSIYDDEADELSSCVVSRVELDNPEFGTIFIEKTHYSTEDGDEFFAFKGGFKEIDSYFDEPEFNRKLLYFIPESEDWNNEDYFVWIHDGLETVMHISLAQHQVE